MFVHSLIQQLQDHYLQKDYETALAMANLMEKQRENWSDWQLCEGEFYRALIELEMGEQLYGDCVHEFPPSTPLLTQLSAQQDVMAQAKSSLLKAEIARIQQDWLQAIERYEQTLSLLETQPFPLERAIANERAALFYLNWQKPRLALGHGQEAIVHYQQANKTTKAALLKQKFATRWARYLTPFEGFRLAQPLSPDTPQEFVRGKLSPETFQLSDTFALMAPVGIFRTDLQGNCLYGDDNSFQMIGLSPQEALGKGWLTALHPEDQARVGAAWLDFVQKQIPFACEYRFLHRDGTLCWVFGQAAHETDSQGNIMGYIGTITDITQQKQMVAALQDSEAKYRRLAESIPGVIYRYLLRPDGSDGFAYVSPRIQDFCNVSANAVEQNAALLWSQVFPEDIPLLQGSIAQSFQTMEPWSCEFRLCRADQTVTWMQGRSIPTRQANGDVIWDGIMIDITDRKRVEDERQQTERALRQQEAYLRTVINHSPVILWALDDQGVFTLSDGQGLLGLGLKPGEAVGLSIFDLYGDTPEVITAFCHTLETGEPYYVMTTINGNRWEGQGTPLFDGNGRVIGVIGVSINITERYQAQQLLTDYNRTLERQVQERTLALAQQVQERQLAEQALREKELFLRSIYDGVADAIFVVDVLENGDFRYAGLNSAHERSTGLVSTQIQGKTPQEILPPDAATRILQHYQDCLAAQDTITYEESLVLKGQETWWLTSLTPLRDPAGRIYRLIGSSTNISDRKKIEAALQQSEATQRQILTALPDLVIWMNRQGQQIQQLNGGGIKSLVSQADGDGTYIHQILPPELAQQRIDAIEQALCTGKPQRYEQQLWVEGSLQDEEVRVIRVDDDTALVIIRDMTEQQTALRELKQARADLQRQQAFLSQVLDVVPSAIAVKDEQGRFLLLNQAAASLYGYPIEQILGRREAELTLLGQPIPQWEQFQPEIMKTLQTKVIPDQMIEPSPGEPRWYQTILAPFIDGEGQVKGMISSSTEITNLKQAERELRQAKETAEAANQAKSIFLANMSHELRTPLNAILGFSQLMARSSNLSPEQQDNLHTIRRSGEHLLTLINQVLDLSKIEAGRMTVNLQPCHLPTLLREVEAMFWLQLKQRCLNWQLWLDPQLPPTLSTDEVKLRQVLINLMSNAVKFTPQGGSIRLAVGWQRSKEDSQHLQFEVTDTGVGIPPQDFSRLILPFVQTRSGQLLQEGTGLGLTISYQFIRLLGGQMTVISHGQSYTIGGTLQEAPHAPLSGTCFRFTIPWQAAENGLPPSLPIGLETSVPRRKVVGLAPHQPLYRLLVVDDYDQNRQLLIKLLQPLGFELRAADNGEEALQIYAEFRPHLIWMDLRMPILDGERLISHIRATPQGQSTVIIALTASVLTGEPCASTCAPWDDLIYKPFQPEEIFTALQTHLGVQFIYEEASLPPVKDDLNAAGNSENLRFQAQDWAALSPDWCRELEQAVLAGDCQAMGDLISVIPAQQGAIANHLMRLVNQYQFEQILSLIQADS